MTEVYSKALNRTIEVSRVIGVLKGTLPGPDMVITAGIHGNEPAGVFALHRVLQELREKNTPLRGTIYALAGNLWALARGERYHQEDLNRMWSADRVGHLMNGRANSSGEDEKEQAELLAHIQDILTNETGPFYFIDLHTTSSQTVPFLTVNDSLVNRRFTHRYPLPIILGIEEYLEGPMLSYLNELGYVSFGFEGGRHDDPKAIRNTRAFLYLTLFFAGMAAKEDMEVNKHMATLQHATSGLKGQFEITYRHAIRNGEQFSMQPGYRNFQKVQKNTLLAYSDGEALTAPSYIRVFMPLYQNQGEDGYFLIRRIPKIFLNLSAWLRQWRADRLLPLLPGVSRCQTDPGALKINRRIARFFTRPFLHLLGFRIRQSTGKYLIVRSREAASRYREYLDEPWWDI